MRLSIISYLLLAGVVVSVNGRREKGRRTKLVPALITINGRSNNREAASPVETEGTLSTDQSSKANEGRLFKHLLFFKSLPHLKKNSESNYMPYVIVNSPATLTNINGNTIGSNPTTGPTVTSSTTTGTGTGTGGTGGTGAGTGTGTGTGTNAGGAVRLTYSKKRKTIPYAVTGIPTPLYRRRNQYLPQQAVYGPPMVKTNRKPTYNHRQSPFSAIANNLKRIKFL